MLNVENKQARIGDFLFSRLIFEIMNFSTGWGKETVAFSRPEEHRMEPSATLATLPKLEKDWRIIHEFKPVAYERHARFALTLCKEDNVVLSIAFNNITTVVKCISDYWPKLVANTGGVPRLGEWTTIEVLNEEEEPGQSLAWRHRH